MSEPSAWRSLLETATSIQGQATWWWWWWCRTTCVS